MTRPLVIHHYPCPDGYAAAWVAWRHFSQDENGLPGDPGEDPGVDFHPAAYKQPVPDVAGRRVYLLDFCYSLEEMTQLLGQAEYVTVIDHHADKLVVLRALSRLATGKFSYTFDSSRSAAPLAWEHFFPGEKVPPLLDYIEDRDLGRNDLKGTLPFSREINASVGMAPYTFAAYNDLEYEVALFNILKHGDAGIVRRGATILKYQEALLEDMLRHAHEARLGGKRIRLVNCNCMKLVSEVALRLARDRPFGAAWFYRGADQKAQFSLRSEPDGMDVSRVAKSYGGGGHTHAAGFEIDVSVAQLLGLIAGQ